MGYVVRHNYIEKLKRLRDTQLIKVVTGVRRCGKSTLLKQFREYLAAQGVKGEYLISLNFEDMKNRPLLDGEKLHEYIESKLSPNGMNYIFLDEVQAVSDFQRVVDSLYIRDNIDLYITGSNGTLLSGQLATLLSGRYIEIKMLPFSFAEYYELAGGDKRRAWQEYFQAGGFPYLSQLSDEEIRLEYLTGIYNTVLVKDVLSRQGIGDAQRLESIARFLADSVGSLVSVKKIADTLTADGRKTTSATVDGYLGALLDAFVFYRADRYDIKGRQHLKSLSKYYLVDLGLWRMILGKYGGDVGHRLENIVYLELVRRGYQVSVGKLEQGEVDFVVRRDGEISYYQVSASVLDPQVLERELAPLEKIKDNYPKYLLTLDELPIGRNGINQVNIVDFLLE